MRLLSILFSLLTINGFSQQKQVNLHVKILPALEKDFEDEKIHVRLLDEGKFVIDTLLVFPFDLNISDVKDTIIVFIGAAKRLPSYELKKIFTLNSVISIESTSDITINFPYDCNFNKLYKNKTCPVCKQSEMAIPIFYGLPAYDIVTGNFKYSDIELKYHGCEISQCDPTWYCKRDDKEF